MENKEIVEIITNKGYIKYHYGYRKITENVIHFITIFGNSFQMYGYNKDDSQFKNIYDTGIIHEFESHILIVLINTFNNNHK